MSKGEFTHEYEGEISYEILLRKMIQILDENESKEKESYSQRCYKERKKDEIRYEKEARKAEAIERSKQRQANNSYFLSKRAANDQFLVYSNNSFENSKVKVPDESGDNEVEDLPSKASLALRRVGRRRELELAAVAGGGGTSGTALDSATALKHLVALVGGEALYDAALGTYDLSLAYLVGTHSAMGIP